MLTEEDLKRIAAIVTTSRDETFTISPEQHYKDHMAIRDLIKVFDEETRQSLRDVAKSYRTGRWVVFIIIALIIGVGTIVYFIGHPKEMIGMLLG